MLSVDTIYIKYPSSPRMKFALTEFTPGWRDALWELSVLINNATQRTEHRVTSVLSRETRWQV